MDFYAYDTACGHKIGEFAPRLCFNYYFLGFFHTDYLYEKDGALHRGHAGDFMIVPPGKTVYHGGLPDAQSGFVNDWIHVGGEALDALLLKFRLPYLTPLRIDPSILAGAIDRIHRELTYRPEGYPEKCELIMADAVIEIYRSYKQGITPRSSSSLEKTRGEIMHDYKRKWTLEEMAKLCGYSQSRFSSIYKETYGISPIEDLIRERIKGAGRLLRYSNMPISEVADAVGFTSLYYFSRAFKKETGVSPTEYRENGDPEASENGTVLV